jgi:hypothetical protein
MSQLIAMIVRIDDMNESEELSEIWRQSFWVATFFSSI